MNRQWLMRMAVGIYPKWWRQRYEPEMLAVLNDLTDDGRSVLRLVLSLLFGALRTRARATGMPKVPELWARRTRFSIAAATLPWVLIAPVIMYATGAQTLHVPVGRVMPTELNTFGSTSLMITGVHSHPAPPLSPQGWVIHNAATAVGILLMISLFVFYVGWRDLIGRAGRYAIWHRPRLVMLARVPLLALLADVTLFFIREHYEPHSWMSHDDGPLIPLSGNPHAVHLLTPSLWTVAVVGWLISVWCVAIVSKSVDLSAQGLRFGKRIAGLIAALVVVTLGAYVSWGVSLWLQNKPSVAKAYTVVTYGHAGWWVPLSALLTVVALLSVASASAARRAYRIAVA